MANAYGLHKNKPGTYAYNYVHSKLRWLIITIILHAYL